MVLGDSYRIREMEYRMFDGVGLLKWLNGVLKCTKRARS
jgi:hypothetical protein